VLIRSPVSVCDDSARQQRRYTLAGRTLAIEDAYRGIAPTRPKLVLDYPRLGPMRSNAKKQSIAIAKKPVASRCTGLGVFTGFGGQLAHRGVGLGGILGGALGEFDAGWVGLFRIVIL